MKRFPKQLYLLSAIAIASSCHPVNTIQTTSVKQFAGTAKEVSQLPYKLLHDYYTIKFKRKQLLPEIYVTGDIERAQLDELAENVLSRLEGLKEEYDNNLNTANEVKTIYDLLESYLESLETMAGSGFYGDLKQKSTQMGNQMNALVTRLNSFPAARIKLPTNPGDWLASLATFHGRNELKAKQWNLLKEYIGEADTLVQAINIHYQEIEVPILTEWFDEEKRMIRSQFKRSIAPYLQNANRHPDSTASIVAFEFFSRINPLYYDLTGQISTDLSLVHQTALMMDEMATTHRSLKSSFDSGTNATAARESLNELRAKLSSIKRMFDNNDNKSLSYYNPIQNEVHPDDIHNR